MSDDPTPFAQRYGPWAVIAGASDGIGECFARQLAERGIHVALLARRKGLLDELAAEIHDTHGVETRPIVADLTDAQIGDVVAEATADLDVGLLVYNAGAVHGARKFHDQPVDHAMTLVHLNCRGPVLLAHHLGGRMRERGSGGIILLTSMAAACGSSYTATYGATKSFELILAEALWHELTPHGVTAMSVVAGATRTPSMLASNEQFESYPNLMEPADVAQGALAHLGKGPCWVAGDLNRETARAFWPTPRVALINGMSAATAGLYDLPHSDVEGADLRDDS
jgi:short-subunit dehydrogenase